MIRRNRHHLWTGLFALAALWAIFSLAEPTGDYVRYAATNGGPDVRTLAARETKSQPRGAPPLVGTPAPEKRASTAPLLKEEPIHTLKPVRVETANLKPALRRANAAADGEAQKWVEVSGASMVNVRDGPGVTNRDIGTLRRGTRLRVLGEEGNWTHIEHPETKLTGWMSSDYLAEAPAQKSVSERRNGTSG